tara:strand:- start:993 stop:2726 length:1734 start_codon:yes stop_codon:yes gene_type:complete
MARVVIEIDGDASGAEAALEEVQESLGGLDEASESAGSSFGGLNTKLVNAASAVGIAKAGFELLRGGINMLWESTERYFTATEDGQAMWEDLERQGRAIKRMLFELFIGTDDQTEAFARMSAIMGDLVGAARGAMAILQPFANLMRGAMSAGARAMSAAFGDAGSMTERFGDHIETAEERIRSLQTLLDQSSDPISNATDLLDHYGQTVSHAVAGVAEVAASVDGLEFDATTMTHGFDEATAQFQQNVADVLASATSLEDLDVPVSAVFVDGLRVVGRGVDNLRDSMAEITLTIGGQQMTALDAWGSQLEFLKIQLDEEDRALRASSEAIVVASGRTRDLGAASASAAMDVVALAIAEGDLAESIKHTNAKMSEQAALAATAEKQRLAAREGKMADIAAADEFEREMMMRRETLREQLEDNEATRAARQQDRVNLAKGGYQTLTTSAIGMVAAHIKAGKQSAEEIRKLIGSELVALGTMGLAKAAMMVFEPGKQALAAGLAVASIAAIGVGAKMGANASGGGGGVAAPASTSAPSVTNVTFQSNFAQIGSRDQFLRVTGDSFQEAVDEGYIALPRGN